MALRPGRCYSEIERSYSRKSRVKEKNYIKAFPHLKIHRFQVGEDKEYEHKIYLVSNQDVQIRHNALEAVRQAIIKHISKQTKDFFLKVLVYPHHVLRENPLATGAGADRFQTGMRLAFGKPIGAAAQVRKGQKIVELRINSTFLDIAKDAMRIANAKLPCKCKVIIL